MDGVFAESYISEGAIFGVYASNSTDEEVGLLEIEERRLDESGDGRGCVDFGFTRGELADRAIFQTVSLREER